MIGITTNGVIEVLIFLLPGFITAWVYYGLSAFPKPEQFERLVGALIFTMLVQGLLLPAVRWTALFIGQLRSVGTWNIDVAFTWTVILALLLGVGVTYAADHNIVHSLLGKLGLTSINSYPSEWFAEFAKWCPPDKKDWYVILTLDDKRRVIGYPSLWPDKPDNGHFSLEEALWLHDGGGQTPAGSVILIPAKSVMFVEFIAAPSEEKKE